MNLFLNSWDLNQKQTLDLMLPMQTTNVIVIPWTCVYWTVNRTSLLMIPMGNKEEADGAQKWNWAEETLRGTTLLHPHLVYLPGAHVLISHYFLKVLLLFPLKYIFVSLTVWLSWLEHYPVQQKVVGLVPGWGAYRRQLIHVSLSHWCLSLSLCLSSFLCL